MRTSTIVARAAGEFATDIRNGLMKPGQKELPSKYLYDTIGSKLFEVIAELPEYGVSRADDRVIRGHASEIVERIAGDVGTYSPRRSDPRLLASPASWSRVADSNPN